MAARDPRGRDLTAEADSGGHTDNQPAISLVPTMLALADEMQTIHAIAPRCGSVRPRDRHPGVDGRRLCHGGGLLLTGTINQACVEAGTSPAVREMLARSSQADVTMAPAADMFEMGVQVQVLKWGTMLAVRARNLYRLYRGYASLDEIPAASTLDSGAGLLPLDVGRGLGKDAGLLCHPRRGAGCPRRERSEAPDGAGLPIVSGTGFTLGELRRRIAQGRLQIWCGPAMGRSTGGSEVRSSSLRNVVMWRHWA